MFETDLIRDLKRTAKPALSEQEMIALGERIKAGDSDAVEIMMQHTTYLFFWCLNKYTYPDFYDLDDVITDMYIGWLEGTRSWDPAKGVKYSVYINVCIRNAFLKYQDQYRKHDVKPSEDANNLILEIASDMQRYDETNLEEAVDYLLSYCTFKSKIPIFRGWLLSDHKQLSSYMRENNLYDPDKKKKYTYSGKSYTHSPEIKSAKSTWHTFRTRIQEKHPRVLETIKEMLT